MVAKPCHFPVGLNLGEAVVKGTAVDFKADVEEVVDFIVVEVVAFIVVEVEAFIVVEDLTGLIVLVGTLLTQQRWSANKELGQVEFPGYKQYKEQALHCFEPVSQVPGGQFT